jgi:guanylate kinase
VFVNDVDFTPVHPEPLLIVISGPSGVGKDAVIQRMKERDLDFHFVITLASRLPRPGEVDGVDYFFVSKEKFEAMIQADELLEHAWVYGEYKGIPKNQIRQAMASGKDIVMRLDVQGAATIRKICPQALLIFLTVENEEELIVRLQHRKSETPGALKLRIATVRQELKQVNEFDYIVINREGHLDDTVETIIAIIRAEHHRTQPRRLSL